MSTDNTTDQTTTQEPTPIKRGRGRPRGSKNKHTTPPKCAVPLEMRTSEGVPKNTKEAKKTRKQINAEYYKKNRNKILAKHSLKNSKLETKECFLCDHTSKYPHHMRVHYRRKHKAAFETLYGEDKLEERRATRRNNCSLD